MAKKNYTFCKIQATSATFNAPEGDKKPSVSVDIKVLECDDPGQIGRTFTEFMSLSGGAVEYTVQNLRALGWSCNDITELEGIGGTTAKGGIFEDTYNGVTREKCAVFKPKPALDKSAKKSFAAQFKAAAAKEKAVVVTDDNRGLDRESLPVQQAQPEFESSEEVPF
jgi:hypothetical protein